MKKTLLISCVLLLTAVGASAQITDVTETYIKNASFETPEVSTLSLDEGNRAENNSGAYVITADALSETGWTLTGDPGVHDFMTEDATATDDNYGVPGAPSDGDQMLYLRNSWAEKTVSVTQKVTLQAGTYMVTVDSKCATSSTSTAALVVGEESTALTIHSTMPEGWDTEELTFTLTEETEVSLGVVVTFANAAGLSVLLDNFKLYTIGSFDNNVTWKLANPSFEVDNVDADLEADGGRGNSVTTLTGWDLSSSEVDHCDLMTKDATETDNNLGVPSAAADGTYWLYLKKSWGTNAGSASVKQKVTLPTGDYKLTVQSMAVAASATARLVAGGISTAITINASAASNDILKTMEWTTNDLVFTISDEEAEVELGVDFTFPTGASVGSILLDNFKLYSVEAIEEEITWEMTDAGWGTMILPFTPTSNPSELTLYDGDALTIEGSTITVGDASESIVANTPYLVKGTAGTYSFSGTPTNEGEIHTTGYLTGTLVDLAVGKGAAFATDGTMYLLQNHEDEDVAFYPITTASAPTEDEEGATLDAYHCYLTIAAEEAEGAETTKLSIILPGAGEETGIVAVEGAEAEANGAIYDLSGRRVAKAVKGVYIQNGKKVLVK